MSIHRLNLLQFYDMWSEYDRTRLVMCPAEFTHAALLVVCFVLKLNHFPYLFDNKNMNIWWVIVFSWDSHYGFAVIGRFAQNFMITRNARFARDKQKINQMQNMFLIYFPFYFSYQELNVSLLL